MPLGLRRKKDDVHRLRTQRLFYRRAPKETTHARKVKRLRRRSRVDMFGRDAPGFEELGIDWGPASPFAVLRGKSVPLSRRWR